MTTRGDRNSKTDASPDTKVTPVARMMSPLLRQMETKGTAVTLGEGDRLFAEGETARGAYLVSNGRVKLTMNSADGKVLILKIAKPGDFLDLGSCVRDKPHEVTAEALEACEVRFVQQADFMRWIQQDGRLCLHTAEILSHDFHEACQEMTMFGLSRTAESRIAALLLRMAEEGVQENGALQLAATHEELSQVVGTSRETVTRVLSKLRRQGVIEVRGSKLTICNSASLRRLANMEECAAGLGVAPIAMSAMHAIYTNSSNPARSFASLR